MDRLTKTSFFLKVTQVDASVATKELDSAYMEFMNRLMAACLQPKENIPAFFTLNYTRVEIVLLQQKRNADSSVKNSPVDQYLLKALLSVSGALEGLQLHQTSHLHDAPKHPTTDFTPQWTADITDLVEISMSLHERRAINNGEISITALVNFLFNMFGMKPGNFFSSYGVMRNRAKSRTLFLDELKRSLERKMDQDDNKEIKRRQRLNYKP